MYRVCLVLFYLLACYNNEDALPKEVLGFESTTVISYSCVYNSPNFNHKCIYLIRFLQQTVVV